MRDHGGELELLCDGQHVGFVRWEPYHTREPDRGRAKAVASEISAVADLLADEDLPWRTPFFYNRGAKIAEAWLGRGLGAWLYAESARLAWVFSRGGVMSNDVRTAGTTSAAARRVWQSRALTNALAFDRFRRVAVWADREHALAVPPPDPPGIQIVREYELPTQRPSIPSGCERARPRENPGDDRRTPAILRHCVAKVAPKRGVSGAYAICTASLQRAGAMRGGKLTAAGRARDARHRRRTPENRAKDAAFERALAVRDNPSPKGQPTPLNLDVLARAFGVLDRIPNRLDPTDAPHLGRCLRAGLIALDGPGHLVLTPAGTEARRRRLAAQPHLMGSANQPRPNPGDGRRRSYAPDYSAPAEGMWVRDPGPAWAQHHRALVAAALRSWSGSPAEMKLHLDDVVAGAPVPGSGSGKMMRAQAEALAWELAHGTKRAPRALYRGSHIEPRGVQSWTTRKNVAERWAARNGGKVWTLPAGTLGLRRMDYASTAFDEEAEWLVDSR